MPNPCTQAVPAPCKPNVPDARVQDNFARRFNTATKQAVAPPPHPNNGDLAIADQCATFTKALPQDSPGKVNPAAFARFQTAIASGKFSDFNLIPPAGMNPPGKLNGPMGAYAAAFVGADSSEFAVPPPPSIKSPDYATELVELYWCSLLRDVAFRDLAHSATAHAACAELSAAPGYQGPLDTNGKVTPEVLFRGGFRGETVGPHVSQLLLNNTKFGALPIEQRYTTYLPDIDYLTDEGSWFAAQQGMSTGLVNATDETLRYLHNGRGLAAWTHVDELYQAYFTAFLVLESMGVGPNPTMPYPTRFQKPFGTFGGPDIAAVLAEVAKYALNAVWYQKWVVHLRHRPEAGAGVVHFIKNHGTVYGATPDVFVFNSTALQHCETRFGTALLSQPFPEGSPTHPAYPTGHGAVGGACITALKFFFDAEKFVFSNPVMANADGTKLTPWTGRPGTGQFGALTLAGELHKLAHNISFGHGIHGGIHWRSDTDSSILLGEAAAISFLTDLVCSYAEPVNITISKIDGTPHTFSN